MNVSADMREGVMRHVSPTASSLTWFGGALTFRPRCQRSLGTPRQHRRAPKNCRAVSQLRAEKANQKTETKGES